MAISRSENMARIRGQDTTPERLLREALTVAGVSVEPHVRTPYGRPDLVVVDHQLAIFIDGCFWHGCPDHYVRPGSREEFWATRLRQNVERDQRQTLNLEAAGWTVVRAWEHEVFTGLSDVVERIASARSPGRVATPPIAWRVVRVDVLDPVARLERRIHVDLRDPSLHQETVGRRRTTQWRRGRS
jgi:DNA mismatch endonuclease (patch repair protein)